MMIDQDSGHEKPEGFGSEVLKVIAPSIKWDLHCRYVENEQESNQVGPSPGSGLFTVLFSPGERRSNLMAGVKIAGNTLDQHKRFLV
jgi:hypothetical protein